MTNPLQSIRIGTLAPGDGPNPAEYIRQILPHGFESFQITFWENCTKINLPKLADEIHHVLDDSGAVISALGVYGNPLENDEKAAETRKSWQLLVENAHLFGTDIVAGFAGRLRDKPIDESMPRFREVFGKITENAGAKNVRIAFENCAMDGDWRCGDWNIAHNPTAWEMMFEAVQLPNIGLEWEPCHQMFALIDPMPQLRAWADRIFHVHGKCCTIRRGVIEKYGVFGSKQFAFHRTPGFGDCNWTDVISDLRAAGFEGAIDIEGWHDPVYKGDLEMTGQVHSLKYLKSCRGGDFVQNPIV